MSSIPERDRRAEELFKRALEVPTEGREALLGEQCDDAQTMELVRSLLAHHARGGGEFLAGEPRDAAIPARLDRIGPYRLLSVIGQGGMGVVYEAERDHPRRKVALKLIRPGLAMPAMLRRFEYEADVLARLEHPGIARVYDAGTADSGHGPQPYFAMELVHGTRLDEHVKAANPRLKQRLELLIEICQAVHHAHTKGVIHRDLKPANIVITADGQPKILDFGVARAIDADVQATTLHTESGQLVGTLPYMAPEQAAGKVNELDTTSDVYALGVIAYELLSGRMPYAVEGKPLHEAVRIICTDEPSRLSSIDKSLRGDVETIVQKALEKDKTRRYATAGELAADVKRYLDYEPIAARPPGTWYQAVKFARRNKVLVGAAAALVLVLLTGVIASTWFAVQAQRQRRDAQQANETTREINRFLNDMLSSVNPRVSRGKPVLVADVLERASKAIPVQFAGRPLVEASIRKTVADTYNALGRSDLAIVHAQVAWELLRRECGEDHGETIASLNTLAAALHEAGRTKEAEQLLRPALNRLPADRPEAMALRNTLGVALKSVGRMKEARVLLQQVYEQRRRTLGDDHAETIAALNNLAGTALADGDTAEAEALYRRLWQQSRRVLGDDHPTTITAHYNLATTLHALGRLHDAEATARDVVDVCRRVLGVEHTTTLLAMSLHGTLLMDLGRPGDAEALQRDVLERRGRILGNDHPDTIRALSNMGIIVWQSGRVEESLNLLRDALDRSRRALGNDHLITVNAIANLAGALSDSGNHEESLPLQREGLDQCVKRFGRDHPRTITALHNFGGALAAAGREDEADPVMRDALARSERVLGPDHPVTISSMTDVATALARRRQLADAEQLYRQALQRLQRTNHLSGREARDTYRGLADVCRASGRPDEAANWRAELAALEASTQPSTLPTTAPATVPVTQPAG